MKEERCFSEDYCSGDACDVIDIKEGQIKHEYNLTNEWALRDNVDSCHFQFVTPEDVKKEDTVESSTKESKSDPISIEEDTLIGDVCKRAFTTPEYCEKHGRICKNIVYGQPSTSTDNLSVAPVLKKKLRLTRDQEGLYHGNQCDYKSLRRPNEHAQRNNGVELHTCKECSKQFTKPSNLVIHMLIHTKEKPHKCLQCVAAFSRANDLKRHMLTHSGERPHKCTQCGKSFTLAGPLKVHMRSHTGEKPFKCTQCGKSFTTSGTLTKHVRIHTGERPYQCTVCNWAFTENSALNNHMKTHFG